MLPLIASLTAAVPLTGDWPPGDIGVPVVPVPQWVALYKSKIGVSPPAPVYTGCAKNLDWGFSFDDGPSSGPTATVLQDWAAIGKKTTFMMVGARVQQLPQVAKSVLTQGHEIAIHSWSHCSYLTLSDDQLITDTLWVMRAIYLATGIIPAHVRPPYGEYNQQTLNVLGAMGLKVILWNRSNDDYLVADNPALAPTILPGFVQWQKEAQAPGFVGGIISLEHDIYATVSALVKPILNSFVGTPFVLKKISECINSPPYVTTFNGINPAISGFTPGLSVDGICAINGNTCPKGQCCSNQNRCGTGTECSYLNCNYNFGICADPTSLDLAAQASALAASPTPVLVSIDGSCSAASGNCPSGQCCSQFGFCGNTDAYCGVGCNLLFGSCNTAASITSRPSLTLASGPSKTSLILAQTSGVSKPISTDFVCSVNGAQCGPSLCCSLNGWCGNTDAYCGQGCQANFGICSIAAASPSQTSQSTPLQTTGAKPISTDGVCAINGFQCPSGQSCSQYNWCGATAAYTGPGCQPAWGVCA